MGVLLGSDFDRNTNTDLPIYKPPIRITSKKSSGKSKLDCCFSLGFSSFLLFKKSVSVQPSVLTFPILIC
jgi:hypothetical protein